MNCPSHRDFQSPATGARIPPMAWLQLFIAAGERRVALESALENLGALAITLRDGADTPVLEPGPGETPLWAAVELCALFHAQTEPARLREGLRRHLGVDTLPAHRFETLADRDWERAWLDEFKPMRFGHRLWILPHDHDAAETDAAAAIVRLDPGLAFGTGTHPTTALCLRWLDAHPPQDMTVIDYGCGSGILALAAARLGATRVLATDNDPQALLATRENARRNGLADRIECVTPEALHTARGELVMANILAAPLIELRPRLTGLTRPGGYLLLAGMLDHQTAQVRQDYADDFCFGSPGSMDGWTLLAGQRAPAEIT